MSGIGFQKLQGEGTTAFDQLVKLGELIDGINRLQYPDIYKQAKMFAPDLELIPIERKWFLPQSANGDFTVNLEGRYFGYWTISHRALNVATSNNNWQRTVLRLYDGNAVVSMNSRDTHGDDILTYAEHPKQLMGFGTAFILSCSRYMSAECTVSFYGFKLGDAVINPPVPDPDPDPEDPEEPLEPAITHLYTMANQNEYLYDWEFKNNQNDDFREDFYSGNDDYDCGSDTVKIYNLSNDSGTILIYDRITDILLRSYPYTSEDNEIIVNVRGSSSDSVTVYINVGAVNNYLITFKSHITAGEFLVDADEQSYLIINDVDFVKKVHSRRLGFSQHNFELIQIKDLDTDAILLNGTVGTDFTQFIFPSNTGAFRNIEVTIYEVP